MNEVTPATNSPQFELRENGQVEQADGIVPAVASEEVEALPEAFPVDVFPSAVARFFQAVAATTRAPIDFAALAGLVSAAAAIGISRALGIKNGSWSESPRICAVIVGDPATGKSPSLDLVLRPYLDIEQVNFRKYCA